MYTSGLYLLGALAFVAGVAGETSSPDDGTCSSLAMPAQSSALLQRLHKGDRHRPYAPVSHHDATHNTHIEESIRQAPSESQLEASRERDVSLQQVAHEDPPHKGKRSHSGAHPDDSNEGGRISGGTWVTRMAVQFLFGLIYYFLIVAKYPKLEGRQPTPESIKMQSENEVAATIQSSFTNCFFSFCCSAPRAAHTFHSAGVLDFWPGCIAMALCPCCTLWLVNSFTDLNTKLGGETKPCLMGLVCACFCSCCVISQDAESLDMITGAKTTFCGVDDQRAEVNTAARETWAPPRLP